jgi:hypothetical protein
LLGRLVGVLLSGSNMVAHGERFKEKPSAAGGFACIVCGVWVNVGESVVAFRNNNRKGKNAWDHVHAENCADKYVPPSLASSSKSSTVQKVANAASAARSSLTGKRRSEDTSFSQKAARLEHSAAQAKEVLEEHGGDEEAALKAMAHAMVASMAVDNDASDDESLRPREAPSDAAECSECSSSEEEIAPQPARSPQFTAEMARTRPCTTCLRRHSAHASETTDGWQLQGWRCGALGLDDAVAYYTCATAL